MTDYFAYIEYIEGGTPIRSPDIGGAAAASDLAPLLAYAMVAIEKRDPRAAYVTFATDAGVTRDLTQAEQKAFDAAYQQVSKDVRGNQKEAH